MKVEARHCPARRVRRGDVVLGLLAVNPEKTAHRHPVVHAVIAQQALSGGSNLQQIGGQSVPPGVAALVAAEGSRLLDVDKFCTGLGGGPRHNPAEIGHVVHKALQGF